MITKVILIPSEQLEGGTTMTDGFELLAPNMKVLYKALVRAHIRQGDDDYEDWLSFARLQYVYHYERRGKLSDIAFNRGVGRLIYLDIEKQRGSIAKDLQRAGRVNDQFSASAEVDITKLEVRETITEALGSMTKLQRHIFVLMVDEGMKQAQIARQLGMSRQSVHGQVVKIRKIMVKVLDQE